MPRLQDTIFGYQLGDAIIERRQWLDISQADLAERLEISPTQLGKYESGRDRVPAIMLVRLASALGTTPHSLLGWEK
jgi:transcriptional regulator with XRE-family HTH domain